MYEHVNFNVLINNLKNDQKQRINIIKNTSTKTYTHKKINFLDCTSHIPKSQSSYENNLLICQIWCSVIYTHHLNWSLCQSLEIVFLFQVSPSLLDDFHHSNTYNPVLSNHSNMSDHIFLSCSPCLPHQHLLSLFGVLHCFFQTHFTATDFAKALKWPSCSQCKGFFFINTLETLYLGPFSNTTLTCFSSSLLKYSFSFYFYCGTFQIHTKIEIIL